MVLFGKSVKMTFGDVVIHCLLLLDGVSMSYVIDVSCMLYTMIALLLLCFCYVSISYE